MATNTIKAVLFDVGGVLVDSPVHAIRAFERENGIAPGTVASVIMNNGADGSWRKLERGEADIVEFKRGFAEECKKVDVDIDTTAFLKCIRSALRVRKPMLQAVKRLRVLGYQTAVITNNWKWEDGSTGLEALKPLFDEVVESCIVGLNKPDPEIYKLCLNRLGLKPTDAAFLDDLGENLRSARAIGITTIRVHKAEKALEDLEMALDLPRNTLSSVDTLSRL